MISHSWYCLLALQLHILGVADSTIYASIVHLYSQLSYINARTLLELAIGLTQTVTYLAGRRPQLKQCTQEEQGGRQSNCK